MKKNIKTTLAVFLTVILLLCAGCGSKPAEPTDDTKITTENTSQPTVDTDITTENTSEPQETTEALQPGDVEAEISVGWGDIDDQQTNAPDDDDAQSAVVPETKPNTNSQTQAPTQPDDSGETVVPEGTTGSTQPVTPAVPAPGSLTYEQFYQLDPEQQELYTDSFGSLKAFNKWFAEAKAAYESTIPDETINGAVDIGKLNP